MEQKLLKYKPFEFQEKAVSSGLTVLLDAKGREEVIVAATAAGKSIIIAEIAKRLPTNGNILVVQPNKELLEQNLEKIQSLGINPAVYSASLKRKEIGRITYATPKSLKVEDFTGMNFKYIIIDECDLNTQGNSQLKQFKKALGIKSALGLTASPIYLKSGLGGAQLKIMTRVKDKFFKDICHVVQIKEMIELGRWSEIRYKQHEFDKTGLVLNSNGSDYTEKSIIENFVEVDTEKKILDILETIPKNESVLIYVPSIQYVEQLTAKIKGAVCVHSKTPEKLRKEYVDGFKSGKYQIMINALVFIAGFDYPKLMHIIDAYPTRSARIYIQKIGRLVRIHFEKIFGTYHDLAGSVESFGKVEDINFEYIDGYGWGMFSGETLLTGVPLSENSNITKTKLREKKIKSNSKNFDFEFDFKTQNITEFPFTFGKHNGKTVQQVYKEDKGYLQWIIKKETNFNFNNVKNGKEIELALKTIFKC